MKLPIERLAARAGRFLLALSIALAVPAAHAAWDSAGVLANPAVNAICADTGPLPFTGGSQSYQVTITSTANATVVFEHRNGVNTANIGSHIFPVTAFQPFNWHSGAIFRTATDERIRVRLNAALTGSMQCSIFHQ